MSEKLIPNKTHYTKYIADNGSKYTVETNELKDIKWLAEAIEWYEGTVLEERLLHPKKGEIWFDFSVEEDNEFIWELGHLKGIQKSIDKYLQLVAMANEPITTRDVGYQEAVIRMKKIITGKKRIRRRDYHEDDD